MKYKYIQLPIYTFIACHFIRKFIKATLTPKGCLVSNTPPPPSDTMFWAPRVEPVKLGDGRWMVPDILMSEMMEQGDSFDTKTGQFYKDKYNDFLNQLGTVDDMAKIARERVSQGWSPDYEAVPSDGSACPG